MDSIREDSLAHYFHKQAIKTPAAVAIHDRHNSITYQELDCQSNRLAHYLYSCGVGPGDRIGIAIERSLNLPMAVLAVLKVGAAYVPFDPGYPEHRLKMMADDSQVNLILVSPRYMSVFNAHSNVQSIDDIEKKLDNYPVEQLEVNHAAGSLAYIIYTSGSTGRPKGVAMPQRALVNLLDWQLQQPGLVQASRTLQFTPLSFDVHFQEFFGTWCTGGELFIIDDVERRDAISLLRFLCDNQIERIFLPFVALHHLAEVALNYGPMPTSLKEIITAGEQLQVNRFIIDFFTSLPGCRLHNHYGPSETHVVTAFTLEGEPASWDKLPPIGKPINNTRVYIVDEHLNPVAKGDAGEIYIAGDCLADGYWQQQGLTEERFIRQKIGFDNRIYRTGDLGKERPDGNIDYLGRIDGQVKIRGYRIETGEIETAIALNPLVKSTVVVTIGDLPTDKKLIAYLVLNAASETGVELIKDFRNEQLSQWQQVWDGTYSIQAEDDAEFDISGWNSSYTGEPLSKTDMHQWVDGAVKRISSLKPARVLEIGCGTGLIMYGLSPHCEYYHGTDFSPIAIKQLQDHIARDKDKWSQCKVSVMKAEDMGSLDAENFDTVILNSVTQHFPGVEYFLSVIDSACNLLKNGGRIFIGDVTNFNNREAFFAELELYRAKPVTSLQDIRANIEKALGEDHELVMSPGLFYSLSQYFPAITSVDLQLKPGLYDNELARFRFDVVLHIEGSVPSVSLDDIDWLDWRNQQDETAPALFLKKYLKSFNPEIIGLKGLSNNRVSKAFASLKLLHNENLVTVADINREINQSSYTSFEAQEFWDIELDSIYKIDVIPAEIPENFDVIARRLDGHGVPLIESYQHVDADSLKPIAYYASQPLNVAIMPRVIEQLRKQLSAQLPDYMLPQRYLLLSRLPMTPSGKLDRRALPLPNNSRPVLEQEYVPPNTDTEISLAGLWSEVLELDQVGVNDNFFDLGGNSILSVSVGMRIRLLLGVDVAVVTLFQYPTIRTLSRYIDNDNQGKNINELVRSRAEKQKKAFAKSVRKYRD